MISKIARSSAFAHCLVAGFFVLLACATTWPLIARSATHIFGELSDPLAWVWFLHWGYHGLFHQPFDLFQANQLYPTESSFAFIYQPLPLQLIYAPLYLLSDSQVFATNVTLIATYALCGFCMYLPIYRWTGRRWIGLCAGCVFALSPIRFPYEQIRLLAMFWTPLAVYSLDRYFRSGRFRDLVWCTVFAVLQTLTAIDLGYFLFLCFLIYVAFTRRWALFKTRKFWRDIALAGLIFAAVVAPSMYPYMEVRSRYQFDRPFGQLIPLSADPIKSYLQPRTTSWLYGDLHLPEGFTPLPGEEALFKGIVGLGVDMFGEEFVERKLGTGRIPGDSLMEKISLDVFFDLRRGAAVTRELQLFQGLIPIVLAFLGFRFLRRHADPHYRRLGAVFLGVTLTGYILSLGPVLTLYDHLAYMPLPFLFCFYLLPGFSVLRGVYRFVFMFSFGLSILAGFGLLSLEGRLLTRLQKRLRPTTARAALAAICCLGLLAESWSVPMPVARVPVGEELPGVHQWLARNQVDGAVFFIPTIKGRLDRYDPNPVHAQNRKRYFDREQLYLYLSTYHFAKMVNGVGSFFPPERVEIFDHLYRLPDAAAVEFFRTSNIRTFVLSRGEFEPEDEAIWTEENIARMGFRTLFEDGQDVILRLE